MEREEWKERRQWYIAATDNLCYVGAVPADSFILFISAAYNIITIVLHKCNRSNPEKSPSSQHISFPILNSVTGLQKLAC